MQITLKDTEKEQLNLTKIKNYDFFGVNYEIVELEPIKQDDNYVETYNNAFFTNYEEIYFENKEIKIKDITNIEKTKEKIKKFKEINFTKSNINEDLKILENDILEFQKQNKEYL